MLPERRPHDPRISCTASAGRSLVIYHIGRRCSRSISYKLMDYLSFKMFGVSHTFLGCTQMHPPGASMHRVGASVVRTGASMHPSQNNIVNRKNRCKHMQPSTCEVRYLFSTVFTSHVNAETMGTVWNLRCTEMHRVGASRCIWVHRCIDGCISVHLGAS